MGAKVCAQGHTAALVEPRSERRAARSPTLPQGAAESSGWAPGPGGRPGGLTCSLLFLRRRLLCSRSLSLTEFSTCSRRAVALSSPKMLLSRSFFSCRRVSCCFRRVLSARAACGRQGFHEPWSRTWQDGACNPCQGHTHAVAAARRPRCWVLRKRRT